MNQMIGFIVVFLGAGIGGSLRHGINFLSLRLIGPHFPYGTLAINIVGSLIMGLLVGYFALKADPGQAWRLFLTTGIVGGFTTFSAFSLEVAQLYERGALGLMALYIGLSVGLSILALFAGLFFMRQL